MIWFNPPYSKSLVTKVATYFLSLFDNHCPPCNKINIIFNRNIIKICYSCIPNTKTVFNSHDHKIAYPKTTTEEKTYNRLVKERQTLCDNCLTNKIICKATLISTNQIHKEKVYFKTAFRLTYSNHKKVIKFLKYMTDTTLYSKEGE